MSIEVPVDRLVAELERWSFCYLLTVSDDGRPHLLALRPTVVHVAASSDEVENVLRFEVGSGRAGHNAAVRPDVTLLFPPAGETDGMSLVVDGVATVDDGVVHVAPTTAVLHRAAPDPG